MVEIRHSQNEMQPYCDTQLSGMFPCLRSVAVGVNQFSHHCSMGQREACDV